jgi:hypothetical protein
MKSYNVQALRGHEYDDHDFQIDMRDVGINIPDNVLYTKDLGPYVINEVYKQNASGLTDTLNDKTGMPYTKPEAEELAKNNRTSALDMYNQLLK